MGKPINFIAQLYDVKAKRNGDGRIVLETGTDSLPALQELLGLLALGDVNVGVAIVPVAASHDSDIEILNSLNSDELDTES